MIDFSKTERELLIQHQNFSSARYRPKRRECYRNGEFPWDAWRGIWPRPAFTNLVYPESGRHRRRPP